MSPPAAASTRPTEPRPARIEVLYCDGCPHQEPVLARMRELLTSRGEPPLIELVRVDSDEDARARRFLGSPTVRIDGADIEPGAAERTDYGLKCRLYRTAAGLAGMPDDAPLLAALERAGIPRRRRPRSPGSA